MPEQSTQRYVSRIDPKTLAALAVVFVLLLVPAPKAVSNSAGFVRTGLIIPLYTYPTDASWTQVVEEKSLHPNVPVVVVINPASGPGTSQNQDYLSGIQRLQRAGITVLGYANTGDATVPLGSVESQVYLYSEWYRVDGIMFDNMANTLGFGEYYSSLETYARSLGMTYDVGNAGSAVPDSYIGIFAKVIVYEASSDPVVATIAALYPGYSPSNFALVAYDVPAPSPAYLESLSAYASAVYFTDDKYPNPYDSLPSYFDGEVALLDNGSGTNTSVVSDSTGRALTTTGVTSTVTSTVTQTATLTSTTTITETYSELPTASTVTVTSSDNQATVTSTVTSFATFSSAKTQTILSTNQEQANSSGATTTLTVSKTVLNPPSTVVSTSYVTRTATVMSFQTTTVCPGQDSGQAPCFQYAKQTGFQSVTNGFATAVTSAWGQTLVLAFGVIGLVAYAVTRYSRAVETNR